MICHCAECQYEECHILFKAMVSVIMVSVIILIVILLSVMAPIIGGIYKLLASFLKMCLYKTKSAVLIKQLYWQFYV
jgi:hypothetical protein